MAIQNTIAPHDNDAAYIATPWLLHQILECRASVQHVFKVISSGASSSQHVVLILADGRYFCDCCMGLNVGIPCRHFFAVLRASHSPLIKFRIGFIRSRYALETRPSEMGLFITPPCPSWLKDPRADVSAIAPVTLGHSAPDRIVLFKGQQISNPLQTVLPATRPTDTLPPQEIHHHVSAALKSLTRGIQTKEQLDVILQGFDDIE